MNTELTDAQRADIRQMARDVMADKDGMAEIDRDLIGYSKVRIDLPLRDTRMIAKHLELLAAAIDRSRVILSYAQKDERASIEASMFFFEKKNQKTFDPWRRTDGMKFFLLLFVHKKKSSLPSPHLTHPGPARAALMRRHG